MLPKELFRKKSRTVPKKCFAQLLRKLSSAPQDLKNDLGSLKTGKTVLLNQKRKNGEGSFQENIKSIEKSQIRTRFRTSFEHFGWH